MSETIPQAERTSEARQAHPVHYTRMVSQTGKSDQEQQEQPTGLGLRPGMTDTSSEALQVFSAVRPHAVNTPTNEARQPLMPIVGHSTVHEYKPPKPLDRSGMSVRGLQFFSSCPG